MRASIELLLGVFERESPPHAAQEDFEAAGPSMRLWQRLGFLGREPGANPVPGCPHCEGGVPYRIHERFLCNRCFSTVDPCHLLLWAFDLDAFLRWLALRLQLRGGVHRIDASLWQLGTWQRSGALWECFYLGGAPPSDAGRSRLAAYRSAILLWGLSPPQEFADFRGPTLSLLEIVRPGRPLAVRDLASLLSSGGTVRFDAESGSLWAGDVLLGEVPVGSKEYHFLACLAERLDRFVPYTDLKHSVLRHAGSSEATEEATFCQNLKSRIKKKWIAQIDRVIVTTNKGDGYRLRGQVGL